MANEINETYEQIYSRANIVESITRLEEYMILLKRLAKKKRQELDVIKEQMRTTKDDIRRFKEMLNEKNQNGGNNI